MAIMKHLSGKELALVLAGLRLLQKHLASGEALPVGIYDILVDGEAEQIRAKYIDVLCNKINKTEN